jgi:hypothetical protein
MGCIPQGMLRLPVAPLRASNIRVCDLRKHRRAKCPRMLRRQPRHPRRSARLLLLLLPLLRLLQALLGRPGGVGFTAVVNATPGRVGFGDRGIFVPEWSATDSRPRVRPYRSPGWPRHAHISATRHRAPGIVSDQYVCLRPMTFSAAKSATLMIHVTRSEMRIEGVSRRGAAHVLGYPDGRGRATN